MKICYYNHTGKISGAERVLFTVISSLDRTRIRPVLLAPGSDPIRSVCESNCIELRVVRELHARFTARPDKLLRYMLSIFVVVRQVRAILKQERPDIVHANSTRAGMVVSFASIGLRVQVLWHVHDILPRHAFSTAIRLLLLSSSRNHVVAVSQATADGVRGRLLARFGSRVPITVVHNAVDPTRSVVKPGAAERLLRSLELSREHFRIGTIGQITARKGQLGLIRVFARLVQSGMPHARLLIVGEPIFNKDSTYLEVLKAETQLLGITDKVLFLGARSDVPALLRCLDVFVLNSNCEPFGLVLLEAQLNGVLVIASEVGGVPELITHNETGKLYGAGDEDALLAILQTTAKDPVGSAQLAAAGRRSAGSVFNYDQFRMKIMRLYIEVNPACDLTDRESAVAEPKFCRPSQEGI